MNAKTLSLLISVACTVAGLVSGLAPAQTDAAAAALSLKAPAMSSAAADPQPAGRG